jgi:tRNA(Ile)-lysidine synthase
VTPAGPAAAIDAEAFAAAMAAFEPFEPEPLLAVAVSGGPDSMALTLLADGWARARRGRVVAFTVDHGLRSDSGTEARTVAAWMAGRGVAHRILAWERTGGGAGETGLQAAAREARYRLLEQACGAQDILHLLLAHTRDDQAETLLLRLSRGSGPDGLAAMPACRELRHVRLLRPLLGFAKADLLATCRAHGQDWVEDPSNALPRYARGRLRAATDALAREGLGSASLALSASRAGGLRAYVDGEVAAFLAAAAVIRPEGYIALDAGLLEAAPPEIAARGLARCLTVIGGGAYPPRHARLMRLLAWLRQSPGPGGGAGATLGGCQIVAKRGGNTPGPGVRHWLIMREPAKAHDRVRAAPGHRLWWDRRFIVGPLEPVAAAAGGCSVQRLGRQGAALLAGAAVPAAVRAGLPGLWRNDRLVGLPAIAPREGLKRSNLPPFFRMVFVPPEPLAGPGFGAAGPDPQSGYGPRA